MRASRTITAAVVLAGFTMGGTSLRGQIVINEVVKEERTAGSGSVTPDTREFIELYNAGNTAVDLAGWSVTTYDLSAGTPLITDTIPSGSIDPGGFFVIGGSAVPNVDFSPVSSDLYPDLQAHVLELRNPSNALEDAVAYEIFRSGLANATTEQLAQIGDGFYGQLISMNANAPNVPQSWSRYIDGRDTDNNGRDFGIYPVTPGASNNLPQNATHTIPDVDGLANGSVLADYHASFILPRAIDPTVATPALNPRAIPASPQGGNAIVAWDHTGGGNTSYSKELVNSFDLYAYFDTTPLGVSAETNDEEWESSMYGIGSADAFFGNPDPTGGIFVPGTVLQNAATGIAWLYQQYEEPTGEADFTKLLLVDMGDGGNSHADAMQWEVIEEIDMSAVDAGWYRLGIDYDPATGDVVATFDDQTFTFTTEADLLGTFFVGYREGITGDQSRFDKLNPPIYDLFVAAPEGLDGDYNDDGSVDAADYVLWRKNVGTTGTLENDPIGGTIGAEHYNLWRANFGMTTPGTGAHLAAAAVPEPAALLLAALAMLTFAAGRRKA